MKRNITFSLIAKLKAERGQTLLRLAGLQETLRSELDPEFDEGDPGFVEQESALALAGALEHKLASIDYALRQAQNGAYGICESCGEPIDPARLEAVPETTFCLGCKVVEERRIRMSAIPVQI
jgi:RNA polymerase-binding transcription factor DksA